MAELIYNIGKDEQKMEIEFKADKPTGTINAAWKQEGNRITNTLELNVPNIPKVTYYLYPVAFLEKTVFINAETNNPELNKYVNAFFLANPAGFYLRIMDNPYVNEIKTLSIHITATGF